MGLIREEIYFIYDVGLSLRGSYEGYDGYGGYEGKGKGKGKGIDKNYVYISG